MALGFDVTKEMLNGKVGQTAVQVRQVFERVETLNAWLANHPVVDTVDPLTTEPFGFTADEAYAMRRYFQEMDTARLDLQGTFDIGRKMTGLE